MDFLIGVMLVIICILLLINFTTISITDSKFGSSNCATGQNYLLQNMQNGIMVGIPSPVPANNSTINSGKINQTASNYDYSKYFFVN